MSAAGTTDAGTTAAGTTAAGTTAADEGWADFRSAVNMAPQELEDWLASDESTAVGQKSSEGSESTGHESGRRIVQLLRTRQADLTDDDAAHMRKVVNYVKRHSAQRPDQPDDELAHSRWAASLKNWGHDPLT